MDVRTSVLSALRWNAAGKFATQLLNWAITIFVIRLLVPGDYGLMAMTAVFVSLISGIADAGLGAAVIQAKTLSGDQLRRVQGAVILACFTAFVALQLIAPGVASFFEEPRLTALVRVVACELLLVAPGIVPGALLMRDLRVKATASVEFTATILGSLSTLFLAWSGFGVWALVFAGLVRALVSTVGLLALAPERPLPRFQISGIGELVKFGGIVTVNQLLHRAGNQLDILLAGKLLGTEQVGAYSVSMHIASIPAAKIGSVVADIVFSAVSRLQHDPEAVRTNLIRSLSILAFVALPVFFGLSSVAEEAVLVVLGAKWRDAILPLMILPIVLPIRMINGILVTAASSMGFPQTSTRYHLTFIAVLSVALAVGASWGLLGLTLAWLVALPVIVALSLGRALRVIGLTWRDLYRCLMPSACSSVAMAGCVHAARHILAGGGAGTLETLVAGVVTGVLAYIVASALFNRKGAKESWRFALRLFGR